MRKKTRPPKSGNRVHFEVAMPTIKSWRERAATARRLAGCLSRRDTELLQYYAAECDFRADCLATGACGRRCALCPLTGERCDGEAP